MQRCSSLMGLSTGATTGSGGPTALIETRAPGSARGSCAGETQAHGWVSSYGTVRVRKDSCFTSGDTLHDDGTTYWLIAFHSRCTGVRNGCPSCERGLPAAGVADELERPFQVFCHARQALS